MAEVMKPDCYLCRHRGTIPGSSHSCCNHPGNVMTDHGRVLNMLGGDTAAAVSLIHAPLSEIKVVGHDRAVSKGWFNWPYNFDPRWLLECSGFEMSRSMWCEKCKGTTLQFRTPEDGKWHCTAEGCKIKEEGGEKNHE